MKRIKRFAALCLAFCLCMAVTAVGEETAQEGSRGLLYEVSGGQADMVLLGSIHIGSEAMMPFGSGIQRAMAAADTFVYECDTAAPEALAEAQARMRRTQGTLADDLGDALYAQLTQVAKQLGLSIRVLDEYQPWAVINTLAVYATAAEMGTANAAEALSLGVERQVQAFAAAHSKPAVYLETVAEQLDMLESFSPELVQYLLQSECDVILNPSQAEGLDAGIALWPTWWRDGDAAAFADNYLNHYLQTGYEEVCTEYHVTLITQRNARMAEQLDELLQTEGSYFVTVGLLHLALPEDSILTHLAKKGYTVTQITQP